MASSAASRQRRARQRRRLGRAVYRVELDEGEIIRALISSGALSEAQALRPRSIEQTRRREAEPWRHGGEPRGLGRTQDFGSYQQDAARPH